MGGQRGVRGKRTPWPSPVIWRTVTWKRDRLPMPNAQGDRKSFRGGRQLSALYKEMLPGQRCTHTHTHHTLHASAKQNFLGQIQTAPLISSSCGVGFLSHLSPHLPFGTLIPLFQGYPRIGKKKKKNPHIWCSRGSWHYDYFHSYCYPDKQGGFVRHLWQRIICIRLVKISLGLLSTFSLGLKT